MMQSSKGHNNGHIQILIADEPLIYGEGLRALLEKQTDFKVVGIAPDEAAIIRMSREQKPDVLLLNVRQGEMRVLDELQSLDVAVRPLLLTTAISGPDLMRALLLGARGVILKTAPTQALYDSIRGVMVGHYWIGNEMGSSMTEAMREYARSVKGGPTNGAFGLTRREMEIISTVVAGYSNAEIARRYGLSEQTVKHHLSSIFDKVGVFNRLELALFAVNHRLVHDEG